MREDPGTYPDELAMLRGELESAREEILRVKARESRARSGHEAREAALVSEKEKLLSQIEACKTGLEIQAARDIELDNLKRENTALKDRCADLEEGIRKQAGKCPLDGSDGARCALLAEVYEYLDTLEDYQRQVLEDAGFSPGNAVIFLCRCGSPNGIASVWRGLRQYIVERGGAWHAVSFLDGLLRFHAVGNGDKALHAVTPRLDKLDIDEARHYWVTPWRENWWLENASVRHVILPGLLDEGGNMLVEPLLALKNIQ